MSDHSYYYFFYYNTHTRSSYFIFDRFENVSLYSKNERRRPLKPQAPSSIHRPKSTSRKQFVKTFFPISETKRNNSVKIARRESKYIHPSRYTILELLYEPAQFPLTRRARKDAVS